MTSTVEKLCIEEDVLKKMNQDNLFFHLGNPDNLVTEMKWDTLLCILLSGFHIWFVLRFIIALSRNNVID